MKEFANIENSEKLQTLLEQVESYLPRSAMIYNVIKLKLELLQMKSENLDVKIFAPSSEGLVALIRIQGLPQTIVVTFTIPTSLPSPQFLQCLQNVIDWSIPHQFEGIENPVAEFIKEYCQNNRGRLELHDPIELHYMPREQALGLMPAPKNIDNLHVGQLDPKDAPEIDSYWPASCPGSLEMLSASIALVGSGGVRILDGNNNEELVSWAVALPFGSIHALHTKKEYGGRGFAKITMRQVSQDIAAKGRLPVAQIYKSNDASLHLNAGIGFIYSHDINLMHYYPN